MTNKEFSNEFDVLYDSISSMDAPGLDDYEKSVFLTKAQLELVKEVNGPVNKYKTGFEGSDKRRADMRELVLNYTGTPYSITTGLTESSLEVILPSNLFLIKYEAAFFQEEGCPNKTKVDIIPIKYDEYHENLRNPFRKPDKESGFRLDISSKGGNKVAELVVDAPIDTYQLRYVKYPNPIVLQDLGGISSEVLSIDGERNNQECELDEEFHREILDRAVEMAMIAYKQEALSFQVQHAQRNN